MKIQWSALFTGFALTTLVGCGAEQFGTAAQSSSSNAATETAYNQYSCTSSTYVKPKVDILYVIDNSGSVYDIQGAVKTAIQNTVAAVAKNNYDYRVISTKLINPSGDSTPNDDYLVLTNSTDALPDSSKKALSVSELMTYFNYDGKSMERGLGRIYEFMDANTDTNPSNLTPPPPTLFRKSAHQIVVVISNGQDDEVAGGVASLNYRVSQFNGLKSSLSAPSFRFLSITKRGSCVGKNADSTYVAMSRNFNVNDVFDICSSSQVASLFTDSTSSITDIVIPHKYRYWPITFAKSGDTENSFGELKVYLVGPNSAPQELSGGWNYYYSPNNGENTRELPAPAGEFVSGRHFIKFDQLVSYPNCIQIAAKSRTEYFGYVVIPRKPVESSLVVTINGQQIPKGTGWSYTESYVTNPVNIKMPWPNAGDELPKVEKTGYMIKLNQGYYYKSGDSVQVNYTPAAL